MKAFYVKVPKKLILKLYGYFEERSFLASIYLRPYILVNRYSVFLFFKNNFLLVTSCVKCKGKAHTFNSKKVQGMKMLLTADLLCD